MKKFYQLTQNDKVAELYIYGDITSYPFSDGDKSAQNIVDEIRAVTAEQFNVYISSYGGEVQAGLAIYNALKRHKAKVRTVCDGFACSIASVIFMAGDERVMNEASLLMIHNAWTVAEGNAAELRKQADDLEKITQASVAAYKAHSNLSEEEIAKLMDNETWISPEEALAYGFATSVEKTESAKASQSTKTKLFSIVRAYQEAPTGEDDEELEDTPDDVEQGEEDEETPEEETEETEEETEDETEETEVTEETEDETEETEEETEETEEEKQEAVQKMNGFFNAFLQIERRN